MVVLPNMVFVIGDWNHLLFILSEKINMFGYVGIGKCDMKDNIVKLIQNDIIIGSLFYWTFADKRLKC